MSLGCRYSANGRKSICNPVFFFLFFLWPITPSVCIIVSAIKEPLIDRSSPIASIM